MASSQEMSLPQGRVMYPDFPVLQHVGPASKKLIMEDHLGDANTLFLFFFFLTLHRAGSIHSENYKMGREIGSIYRIKKQEQGEKNRNSLAGAT